MIARDMTALPILPTTSTRNGRAGVGTYTLTKLLEECRKRNMRKACGIIFADNAGSIALMKRFGFTQFGLMPTAATDSTGTMRDMSYWYLDL